MTIPFDCSNGKPSEFPAVKKIIHPLAGTVALLTIASFWLSTVLSELFGSTAAIVAVKSAIPWGFLLLVPAMAAAGGSGFALAGKARTGLVGAKMKRMPVIAANGLLVLIPAALYLASKAKAGEFDGLFYAVQGLELVAGATNLALLGLNMRDGFRMSGRFTRSNAAPVAAKLLGSETIADGTMAFRFTKPEGFSHRAGQSAAFALGDLSRVFSIASAPHEPDLLVATRMRDTDFKRALKSLQLGNVVRIAGVGGAMVLDDNAARPAVFLAGGIGVTPFLAMARDATSRNLPQLVTMFYCNRKPEDAAYLEELQDIAAASPTFKLVATMTEPQKSIQGWAGETGRIDAAMLARHVSDVRAPVYYLAGPAGMVDATRKMLLGLGVAGKDIRFEEFTGY